MSDPEPTDRNRPIVESFARALYIDRDVERAFIEHVAADYVQHNPGMPDGRQAAIDMLTPKFSKPGASFEVKRILVDGDLAVVHVHARMGPDDRGSAVVDIFRLENGSIVEHWDVLQPVPETAANPHPMF